jgi:sugar phosphate isomerase/epimerase
MQIGVSSWSFHAPLYAGSMRLSDVPLAAYRLGIRHVELNDLFLTPPPPGRVARLFGAAPAQTDRPDYGRKSLMRLHQARLRSGARLACWTTETDLTVDSPQAKQAQRAHLGTAIEAARFLGAPIMRLTLGGEPGDGAGVGRAIDLLRGVVPVAIAAGVRLAIENHGGLSSQAGALEEVVAAFRAGGDPQRRPLGVCLDLGHFSEGAHAAGVARLAPLAIHVHAAARAFGEDGEEVSLDYAASMAALRAAGYAAVISIEYTGEGDPGEGIATAKALIEKHWPA